MNAPAKIPRVGCARIRYQGRDWLVHNGRAPGANLPLAADEPRLPTLRQAAVTLFVAAPLVAALLAFLLGVTPR